MADCLFCKIGAGEIPTNKVYEDERVVVFHDIDPKAPTHLLAIPKEHVESCGAITPENSPVVAYLFEVIARVTAQLGIREFRVVSNCGAGAGQSVFHLHFHVLAGRSMAWPPG
jgi:histidine triad (HIT) family protein